MLQQNTMLIQAAIQILQAAPECITKMPNHVQKVLIVLVLPAQVHFHNVKQGHMKIL